MNWQKLNKKTLKTLRVRSERYLVASNNPDYPFDVIEYLEEDEDLLPNPCWVGILNNYENEYGKEEMLNLFTHFCVINNPGE